MQLEQPSNTDTSFADLTTAYQQSTARILRSLEENGDQHLGNVSVAFVNEAARYEGIFEHEGRPVPFSEFYSRVTPEAIKEVVNGGKRIEHFTVTKGRPKKYIERLSSKATYSKRNFEGTYHISKETVTDYRESIDLIFQHLFIANRRNGATTTVAVEKTPHNTWDIVIDSNYAFPVEEMFRVLSSKSTIPKHWYGMHDPTTIAYGLLVDPKSSCCGVNYESEGWSSRLLLSEESNKEITCSISRTPVRKNGSTIRINFLKKSCAISIAEQACLIEQSREELSHQFVSYCGGLTVHQENEDGVVEVGGLRKIVKNLGFSISFFGRPASDEANIFDYVKACIESLPAEECAELIFTLKDAWHIEKDFKEHQTLLAIAVEAFESSDCWLTFPVKYVAAEQYSSHDKNILSSLGIVPCHTFLGKIGMVPYQSAMFPKEVPSFEESPDIQGSLQYIRAHLAWRSLDQLKELYNFHIRSIPPHFPLHVFFGADPRTFDLLSVADGRIFTNSTFPEAVAALGRVVTRSAYSPGEYDHGSVLTDILRSVLKGICFAPTKSKKEVAEIIGSAAVWYVVNKERLGMQAPPPNDFRSYIQRRANSVADWESFYGKQEAPIKTYERPLPVRFIDPSTKQTPHKFQNGVYFPRDKTLRAHEQKSMEFSFDINKYPDIQRRRVIHIQRNEKVAPRRKATFFGNGLLELTRWMSRYNDASLVGAKFHNMSEAGILSVSTDFPLPLEDLIVSANKENSEQALGHFLYALESFSHAGFKRAVIASGNAVFYINLKSESDKHKTLVVRIRPREESRNSSMTFFFEGQTPEFRKVDAFYEICDATTLSKGDGVSVFHTSDMTVEINPNKSKAGLFNQGVPVSFVHADRTTLTSPQSLSIYVTKQLELARRTIENGEIEFGVKVKDLAKTFIPFAMSLSDEELLRLIMAMEPVWKLTGLLNTEQWESSGLKNKSTEGLLLDILLTEAANRDLQLDISPKYIPLRDITSKDQRDVTIDEELLGIQYINPFFELVAAKLSPSIENFPLKNLLVPTNEQSFRLSLFKETWNQVRTLAQEEHYNGNNYPHLPCVLMEISANGMIVPEEGCIGFSKELMKRPFWYAFATYIHEVSHFYGRDESIEFGDALQKHIASLIEILIDPRSTQASVLQTANDLWTESLERERSAIKGY